MLDIEVVGRDTDGIVLGDKNCDRCYVYFSEIPGLIELLSNEYVVWRESEVL